MRIDGFFTGERLAKVGQFLELAGEGRFSLTERGQSAHDGLADVVAELRTTLVADLSEADQAQAAATLERMARNLGWDG